MFAGGFGGAGAEGEVFDLSGPGDIFFACLAAVPPLAVHFVVGVDGYPFSVGIFEVEFLAEDVVEAVFFAE